MIKNKEFFSTGEVAKMLKVSPTTIFRAISGKRLAASTTPGGHYRISRENLDRFLRQNKMPAPTLPERTFRVLIVEDNLAELRIYERVLAEGDNMMVRGTPSGYQAGFMTKSFMPDLLVLDVFLQEGDGRDIARLIRSDPILKGIKILAITGSRDVRTHEEVRREGVDGILLKPFDPDQLRERVLSLLRV